MKEIGGNNTGESGRSPSDRNPSKLSPFVNPFAPPKEQLQQLRGVRDFYREAFRFHKDVFFEIKNGFKEALNPPTPPTIVTGRIAEILSQGDPATRKDKQAISGRIVIPSTEEGGKSLVGQKPGSEHPTEHVAYPYYEPDWHDTRHPMRLPENIASTIRQVAGPIVELGGPTRDGYRLLGDSEVFSSPPLITDANFYGHDGVEKLDATNMPFFDSSIGMFLVKNMGSVNWSAFEARERRKTVFGFMQQQERWGQMAEQEMEALIKDTRVEPQLNLHAKIIREAARTLAPGGLLLWENIRENGIAYAARLGLEAIYFQPQPYGARLSALFKKTSDNS